MEGNFSFCSCVVSMQLLSHSVSQRLVSNIINSIVYTLLWDVAGNIQHMSLTGELLEVLLEVCHNEGPESV